MRVRASIRVVGILVLVAAFLLEPQLAPASGGDVFAAGTKYCGSTYEGRPAIADIAPPLSSLADGVLVTIEFVETCEYQVMEAIIAPVKFFSSPAASFPDTGANDIPGATYNGSINIPATGEMIQGVSGLGLVFATSVLLVALMWKLIYRREKPAVPR